jgi:pyrroloquinoline quinone (PQQ) biosynthesis protein C
MWLDFAEGVGLSPEQVRCSQPSPAVHHLIECFYRCASHASPAEVLAALYAYESQVARISGEKARALMSHYGVDARTCGYFALHTYADVLHSRIWQEELVRLLARSGNLADAALDSAERAARWLWQALDDSEAHRRAERSFSIA